MSDEKVEALASELWNTYRHADACSWDGLNPSSRASWLGIAAYVLEHYVPVAALEALEPRELQERVAIRNTASLRGKVEDLAERVSSIDRELEGIYARLSILERPPESPLAPKPEPLCGTVCLHLSTKLICHLKKGAHGGARAPLGLPVQPPTAGLLGPPGLAPAVDLARGAPQLGFELGDPRIDRFERLGQHVVSVLDVGHAPVHTQFCVAGRLQAGSGAPRQVRILARHALHVGLDLLEGAPDGVGEALQAHGCSAAHSKTRRSTSRTAVKMSTRPKVCCALASTSRPTPMASMAGGKMRATLWSVTSASREAAPAPPLSWPRPRRWSPRSARSGSSSSRAPSPPARGRASRGGRRGGPE